MTLRATLCGKLGISADFDRNPVELLYRHFVQKLFQVSLESHLDDKSRGGSTVRLKITVLIVVCCMRVRHYQDNENDDDGKIILLLAVGVLST